MFLADHQAKLTKNKFFINKVKKVCTYLVDAAIYAPFVRAALKLESVAGEQGQAGARRVEVLDRYHLSKRRWRCCHYEELCLANVNQF